MFLCDGCENVVLFWQECQLWVKAHCLAEEERSKFYVERLLEFVSPCKIEVGAALRRLSQLPGRLNTPVTLFKTKTRCMLMHRVNE